MVSIDTDSACKIATMKPWQDCYKTAQVRLNAYLPPDRLISIENGVMSFLDEYLSKYVLAQNSNEDTIQWGGYNSNRFYGNRSEVSAFHLFLVHSISAWNNGTMSFTHRGPRPCCRCSTFTNTRNNFARYLFRNQQLLASSKFSRVAT